MNMRNSEKNHIPNHKQQKYDYICIDVNFIWGREKKKMFVCVKLICALSEKYVALCNYACSSIIMFAEDANGWNCIVPLKLNVK